MKKEDNENWNYPEKILNKKVESLYQALNVLKSNSANNPKAHLLLEQFKIDNIKSGNIKEINEEQRKLIVQANAANDEKDYSKALEL